MSQTTTLPSKRADAIRCPSGLNARLEGAFELAARTRTTLPVETSQREMVLGPLLRMASQAVKVVAGAVAHLDSVLGSGSIGCSPPEMACRGRTTKTHFKEDVRFASDCDIALEIWEFAGPSLFIDS